ncbi:MAG TPA: DUF6537 domain-containing protein, partial [bacterium]|nr:DUF6537 domain-containing protein [bacterium]
GNKVFVNILLLGAAFQRGLLPLTLEEMLQAIRESFNPSAAKHNLDAFHLGRDLVLNPGKYGAEVKPGLEEVVRKKEALLGGRRGRAYRAMLSEFLGAWTGDEETRLQFASRLYDLIEFEDPAYARGYLDRVMAVLRKDSPAGQFAATQAVVKYLHKVMEIKDEVYVAHLLTSPEKYEKDARRYKMDLAAGDRITYRHFNRPEFDLWGLKIVFDLDSRDWMLRGMKRLKFLRRLLPSWHAREKAFRAWYQSLVDRFEFTGPEQYDRWVRALSVPDEVRGYRAIRYPKMERAQDLADQILSGREIPQAIRRPRPASSFPRFDPLEMTGFRPILRG